MIPTQGKGDKWRSTNFKNYYERFPKSMGPKKTKWPTLAGRLANPLTSKKEALEQLSKSIPVS